MDVAVVGGSVAGVAAALELAGRGLSVVVVSARTYLGEDVCGTLRLALPRDLDCTDPLAKRLYDGLAPGTAVRPMHVKLELERALREAGVPVLLSTAPGELLFDEIGRLAGLTLCSRAGRGVLRCRALLDSTLQGHLARAAGLPLTPSHPRFLIERRVIGGREPSGLGAAGVARWIKEAGVRTGKEEAAVSLPLWVCQTEGSLPDGSWAAWMALEQRVRIEAYRPGQAQSAEEIFAITGERLHPGTPEECLEGNIGVVGAAAVSALDGRLWFTGAVANVDAETLGRTMRHDLAPAWGRIVARHLATAIAPSRGDSQTGILHSIGAEELPPGVIACDPLANPSGEALAGNGGISGCAVEGDGFSAIENFDVLVVGGGTGGAPAGIAAAREGARTLVAEFLGGLGGVGTLGLIGEYWFGNRVGFTAEIDAGVAPDSEMAAESGKWQPEAKMHWYHEQLTRAGGAVWYQSMTCGALLDAGGRIAGALLATPRGRIAVLADCTVDATGSADVAAAAGAETSVPGQEHLAVQGTGLPPRELGARYINTDYDFVDETDARDSATAFAAAREKFRQAFDLGQLIDSRERRRIVGDCEVMPEDILLGRVFPDTIVTARSNFDTHGFTVYPRFLIAPPDKQPVFANVPLRALLPRGLDGLLVTGLGISAHRDAMPVIRMQADVQNQGYAAGLAAAMAGDRPLRELPVADLQRRLVMAGILAPDVAGARDSFPLPDEEIRRAIDACGEDPGRADPLFTLPAEKRIALLREAHRATASPVARRNYAFLLGILGDASGASDLAQEIAETPWDAGWNFRGMGQFGASLSPLDARIIALGRTHCAEHLPVLLQKAEELPGDAEFSHYRALAEAFETIGDVRAVPVLAALLGRPGIAGHSHTGLDGRLGVAADPDTEETRTRNNSLVEMHLARALLLLDPSHPSAREILGRYSKDVRAIFSRHATALLGLNGGWERNGATRAAATSRLEQVNNPSNKHIK